MEPHPFQKKKQIVHNRTIPNYCNGWAWVLQCSYLLVSGHFADQSTNIMNFTHGSIISLKPLHEQHTNTLHPNNKKSSYIHTHHNTHVHTNMKIQLLTVYSYFLS